MVLRAILYFTDNFVYFILDLFQYEIAVLLLIIEGDIFLQNQFLDLGECATFRLRLNYSVLLHSSLVVVVLEYAQKVVH